nr:hypothetical protein [uncultured Tyzzerella sp.]
MKEKNIFLMGLGTGLVITSIVALFSYNILSLNNSFNSNIDISTTTISQTEQITNIEPTSQTTSQNIDKKLELSSKPNLEITTEKPFELSSQ